MPGQARFVTLSGRVLRPEDGGTLSPEAVIFRRLDADFVDGDELAAAVTGLERGLSEDQVLLVPRAMGELPASMMLMRRIRENNVVEHCFIVRFSSMLARGLPHAGLAVQRCRVQQLRLVQN